MANIKSAIKRVQVSERNRLHNKAYKSAVRTLTKNYFEAVAVYQASPSADALTDVNDRLSLAYSKIDRAVKRGVLHRNTGARRKARLAHALKSIQPAPAAE